MKYKVTSDGFYGKYGGAFVPEMLYPNLEELKNNYKKIIDQKEFKKDYDKLLKELNSSML